MAEHRGTVLLVDDDKDASESLIRLLKRQGLSSDLCSASTASLALEVQRRCSPEVGIVDLCLEKDRGIESGFELIKALLCSDRSMRLIVLTGHGSNEIGVRALKLGAASFVEKPANSEHLLALVEDGIRLSRIQRAASEGGQLPSDVFMKRGLIVGESQAAKRLREQVAFAAATRQPVLICGETGTGKGNVARAIHELAGRQGRFVICQPNFSGADLVYSELFGHLRGAFTGAHSDRSGLLAEADGGTLFLDEVDQFPHDVQVRLLSVLQDRCFRPLGGGDECRSDFRLVCATNAVVSESLAAGALREDFYHRVAHFVVELPPLRERGGDIALLAEHFLLEISMAEGLNVFELSSAAVLRLSKHPWPGNIRELRAVVEGAAYAANYCRRGVVISEDLQFTRATRIESGDRTVGESFRQRVEDYKFALIDQAIAKCGGCQAKAARSLGMERSTLRRIVARRV